MYSETFFLFSSCVLLLVLIVFSVFCVFSKERREKFSRRRAFNEDEDISYINERNRVFNKKIARA